MGTLSTDGHPTRSSRATASLVVAGRLALLLLAGLAAVSGFVLSRGGDRAASDDAGRYSCPMHPEVTSSRPDRCPVCRMALEPVSPIESPSPTVVARAERRVLTLDVRAAASVETGGHLVALLYNDEAAGLSRDEQGLFFRASAPFAGIVARVAGEPPVPWDESTSRVRFRLDPGTPRVPAGEVGWLSLAARRADRLVVPVGAVLYSSQGPYVLAADAHGRPFSVRRVQVGRVYRGLAVVLSGLREGEPIAGANAFFLDAERRLQSLRQESGADMGTSTGEVAR